MNLSIFQATNGVNNALIIQTIENTKTNSWMFLKAQCNALSKLMTLSNFQAIHGIDKGLFS